MYTREQITHPGGRRGECVCVCVCACVCGWVGGWGKERNHCSHYRALSTLSEGERGWPEKEAIILSTAAGNAHSPQ